MSVAYHFGSAGQSIEYNFSMPNVFYVQLKDQERPCKIHAETVEERGGQETPVGRLVFKTADDQLVGNFRSLAVQGWWKEDERS